MNAHEFLAKHGIDEAKRVLSGAPDWAIFWISRDQYHGHILSFPNMTGHYSIKLSELKQVVESVEFIEKQGGVFSAKTQAIDIESSLKNGYKSVGLVSMKYAIADYELVESYKQEKCEVLDMVDVSPRCEVRNG